MANNPYINKVEYAGQTLMDLTGDTVTPSDVLNGVSFHDRSGALQQGSLITHNVYDGLDSTSTSDALSANQGKVLKDLIDDFQPETDSSFSPSSSRYTALSGGVYLFGNFGVVNLKYKSKASATNTPQIAMIDTSPICDTALLCIDITTGIGDAIQKSIPAGIGTNGRIYQKEIETDHIYAVSGFFVVNQS